MTVLSVGLLAGGLQAADSADSLKTTQQKASYAIGKDIGGNFKRQGLDLDADALSRGLKDALSGAKSALSDEEIQAAITTFQTELQAKQQEKAAKASETNKKAGEDFLAANKKKEGVTATASGLQYKVLKPGTGPKPKATDTVTAHYRGTLIDGTEFDSSYKRGEPASFPLNGVIKGWQEALPLMGVGSKWQIVIPSALAYGERGAGEDIGPNSTLIFEVELLAIGKGDGK